MQVQHVVRFATFRPAGHDPKLAIGERREMHVSAASQKAAEQLAEQMLATTPPVEIGGKQYAKSVIPRHF